MPSHVHIIMRAQKIKKNAPRGNPEIIGRNRVFRPFDGVASGGVRYSVAEETAARATASFDGKMLFASGAFVAASLPVMIRGLRRCVHRWRGFLDDVDANRSAEDNWPWLSQSNQRTQSVKSGLKTLVTILVCRR
jgi:hypothetical protein